MLISKLQKILQISLRFRNPKTIRAAIYKISHNSLIEQIPANCPEEELIELVAKFSNSKAETLQQRVAKLIGLRYCDKLHLPTKDLLDIVGLSVETLKSIPAVPQIMTGDNNLCALLVANTEKISIDDFRKAGIAVILASNKAINDVWQQYDDVSVEEKNELKLFKLKTILEKLIVDLIAKHKINILTIAKDRYYFESRKKSFRGNLQKEIYQNLNSLLKSTGHYKFSNSSIENLTISQTAVVGEINISWAKKPSNIVKRQTIHQINTEKTKILLIDDSLTYRTVVANILSQKGFDVCAKSNGDDALRFLAEKDYHPDLIICDVHMPVLNGPGFVRKMRDFGAATPILMLTSDEDSSTEIMLAEIGADACVKKSEDPEILVAWCKRLTRKLSVVKNTTFTRNLKKQVAYL